MLYWENFPKRVRAEFGGAGVADSRRMKALHETGKFMGLYFPREDVDQSLLEPSELRRHSESERFGHLLVGSGR